MTKIEDSEDNIKKCPCANCPSYNECAKTGKELLYCADKIGKSKCALKMNGCICGGCPVYRENKLEAGYYCINGSATEIEN